MKKPIWLVSSSLPFTLPTQRCSMTGREQSKRAGSSLLNSITEQHRTNGPSSATFLGQLRLPRRQFVWGGSPQAGVLSPVVPDLRAGASLSRWSSLLNPEVKTQDRCIDTSLACKLEQCGMVTRMY